MGQNWHKIVFKIVSKSHCELEFAQNIPGMSVET